MPQRLSMTEDYTLVPMRDDEPPAMMEQITPGDRSGKDNNKLVAALTWRSEPQEDIL